MSVRFFLEGRPNKKGEHPVRCQICIKGKRLSTTVGFSLKAEFWDQDGQKVKLTFGGKPITGTKKTPKELNSRLKRIDSFFSDYEDSLWASKEEPADLKEMYKTHFGMKDDPEAVPEEKEEEKKDARNIKDYLEEFLAERKDKVKWRELTVRSMATLKVHMTEFIDANNVKSIDYFNEDGVTNFVNFLIKDKDLRNSTIEKYLSRQRYFLRWAYKKGYTSVDGSYKPKLQQTKRPIVFLEWDDLMKLLDYEFPEVGTKLELKDMYGNKYEKKTIFERESMERVRDAFCFCCFTSLRYSDLKQLKRTNVFPDYILLTTKKDTDTVKIELNRYSKAILDKYRSQEFPNNNPLPIISEPQMNQHLKEMGEICGYNSPVNYTYFKGSERIDDVFPKWEWMTTHVGRKTFICNSLMLGISPQIVMRWSGHSDYEAMKPYIAIADSAKKDAMSLFDKKGEEQEKARQIAEKKAQLEAEMEEEGKEAGE